MTPRHLLLAALALLLVALPAGAPQAQETIKIGYIDPLSGPFAATGENGLNQFRMAAER
ncbi:MAG: branched-chain amino acid ABC transporter substrate-binding protein, partial [Candidatus Rokubacteria bacterium]|nr:branched-chain amino acid ABC transporter substrate-binding protein [Candidatus Rokubacteria bacterium]